MKKVITFGSFDILHEGHKHYLQEAKSYGDYLTVIVARDSNIKKFKGRAPQHNEQERLAEVEKLDFVDQALLGKTDNIFDILDETKPDVICLGYDQSTATGEKIKEELENRNIKADIIRAQPFKPEIYKSSKFRAQ